MDKMEIIPELLVALEWSASEGEEGTSNLVKINGSNHHSLFFAKFRHFYQNSGLFDLKIVCAGGQAVFCHSIMLASCSSRIESLLAEAKGSPAEEGKDQCNSDQPGGQGEWNQSKVIFLPEVDHTELELIVKFVYNGELSLTKSMLGRLCKLSQDLKFTFFPSENDVKDSEEINQMKNESQIATATGAEEDVKTVMMGEDQEEIDPNSNKATEMEVEETTKETELIKKTMKEGIAVDIQAVANIAPTPCPELQKRVAITSTSSGIESQSQQGSPDSQSFETVSSLLAEGTSALDLELDIPSMDSTAVDSIVTITSGITPSSSTKAKRPFVQRDLEQGYSLKEIAERNKVSYKIVRRWRIEYQRLLVQMNSRHLSSSLVVQSDKEYRKKSRAVKRKFVCSSDEEIVQPEVMKKICKMLISSSKRI